MSQDTVVRVGESKRVNSGSTIPIVWIPLVVLAVLILLLLLASFFNSQTYFYRIVENRLELWHGDFAPMGVRPCSNFESLSAVEHDYSCLLGKKFRGIERAYGGLFQVFVDEINEELDRGREGDLKKINGNLKLADKYLPFCSRVNPGYARSRFEISWKRVEHQKDLLSVAYDDALKSMAQIERLGVAGKLDLDRRKKEANAWLSEHPMIP